MKQLGNLTIVCAQRPEVLMQLHEGRVTVYVGSGPDRAAMHCAWDDDTQIKHIVYELNFGKHAKKRIA